MAINDQNQTILTESILHGARRFLKPYFSLTKANQTTSRTAEISSTLNELMEDIFCKEKMDHLLIASCRQRMILFRET